MTVWELKQPEGVRRVWDRNGDPWKLYEDMAVPSCDWQVWVPDGDALDDYMAGRGAQYWHELVAEYGPLTDEEPK